MDKLLQTLKSVGLNEKEAKTYLCLLGLGPQSVSVVAKKIGISRSSCYVTLEHLMQKGFVEKLIQENNTPFRAVDPIYLLDQLKSKQYELDSTIETLGMALKGFGQLKSAQLSKPKVIFFQDESGLQNILENTLTSSEPLRAYVALEELTALLPNYMPRYYQKRVQQGLHIRAIYPGTLQSYLHKKHDTAELRETRLVTADYNFHLAIIMYDNKVTIASLKEKFGIFIESKEMAQAIKEIFDLFWKNSAVNDQKITDYFAKKTSDKIKGAHPL